VYTVFSSVLIGLFLTKEGSLIPLKLNIIFPLGNLELKFPSYDSADKISSLVIIKEYLHTAD